MTQPSSEHYNETLLYTLFKDNSFGLRKVGGCVRDSLLGISPKDIDFCTNAIPEDIMALGRRHPKIKVIPTGLDHGTITFHLNGENYEITTLRIDESCDGRHASVRFTQDWKEDAARRDLTINAMMMDSSGKVYDWFNGQQDLKDRTLRFVGDPEKRITEDYLRILRFFRFTTKFPATGEPIYLDESALHAIQKNKDGLQKISVERIWTELKTLLSYQQGIATLPLLQKSGILSLLKIPYHSQQETENLIQKTKNPLTILASQMTRKEDAENFAKTFKISSEERDVLVWLTQQKSKITETFLEDSIALGKDKDLVKELAHLGNYNTASLEQYSIQKFPVSGDDLKKLGFTEGKDLGKALQAMKQDWIESRYTKTQKDLLKPYVKQKTQETEKN